VWQIPAGRTAQANRKKEDRPCQSKSSGSAGGSICPYNKGDCKCWMNSLHRIMCYTIRSAVLLAKAPTSAMATRPSLGPDNGIL
jgi:hypothetical protein